MDKPSISSRMMTMICYYVVFTMLLFSLVEFHPTLGLPISPDTSQDAKEVKSFPITKQFDLRRSEGDRNVDPVNSSSVSLFRRIRRSAEVSDESMTTASPEKSNRKKVADGNRNSYHNRSGWGGGYGRRR